MRVQGEAPAFREWAVELEVEVTAEVLARAVREAHERWGSSALVLGSEGRVVRVHGPDSEGAIAAWRSAVERPVEAQRGRARRSR